ncbi:MAG: tetratricopeptide repeat protein [Pseudomonadota bacterium]
MTMTAAATYRHLALILSVLGLYGCSTGPELRTSTSLAASPSKSEGKRLLEEGRAVEAVASFRRHLREEGADLRVLNGLAIAYSELGKPDLAAEIFSRALTMAPDDPATLNNIGFAALRRADKNLARRYLKKAQLKGSGFDKIKGNLAGLDWLEGLERKHPKGPHLAQALLPAKGRPPNTPLLVSLPKGGTAIPSTRNALPDQPQQSPPSFMLDFTTVVDPFSSERTAE